MSLEQAKEEFFQELNTGKRIECPCCTRTAAIGRRTIDRAMARTLRHIHRRNEEGDEWVNTSHELSHGLSSTAALLRHWGLAVSKGPVSKGRNKDSGFWKITDLGRAFVEGVATIPRSIRTWKGQLVGNPFGEPTNMDETLARKFRQNNQNDPT